MDPMSSCSTPSGTAPRERLAARPSRVGRWRALVLLLVHVAIALHAWHWYATGRTLSPLEPSESMAFSQRGIVNAGLIFFALAILSTLIFGRWFCGWGCHLIALQDGARWILRRVGLRTRGVNLGLLASVPWLAFVYMFLSPIVLALLEGTGFVPGGAQLETEQFWKTFPPWPVALVSVIVCGFAIVWLLGQKGFCSYGCPYGAIFGIADQFAPSRIRVNDDCAQCGHCTVACSSGVNVSQEVREWGMVVDPGCMKCADCVSVCPKDALYVGWGAPALFASRRAEPRRANRARWAERLLLLCFFAASFALLHLYDGRYGAYLNPPSATLQKLVGVLTLGSFAVAWLLRGSAQRTRDYGLGEELLLALFFLAALYAFHGLHGWSPLLLTLALATIFAWFAVELVRLVRRSDLAWRGWRLKREGRLTSAGRVCAACGLLAGAAFAAASWDQARQTLEWRARIGEARLVLEQGRERAGAGDAAAAVQHFQRALELDPQLLAARRHLGLALCASGRYPEGLQCFRTLLEELPGDASLHAQCAGAALATGDVPQARRELDLALRCDPRLREAHELLCELLAAQGDAAGAEEQRRILRELGPAPVR